MVPDPKNSPRYPWIFPAGALLVAALFILAAALAPFLPWGGTAAGTLLVGYLGGAIFVRRPVLGVALVHLTAGVVTSLIAGPWAFYFIFIVPFLWVPLSVGWLGGNALAHWLLERATWRMARTLE